MIKSLTKEQEAKIPEYREQYLKIGLSTEPCDHKKAEDAVAAYYDYVKMERPQFMWAQSPEAGAKLAAQLATGKQDVTDEEIKDQYSKASYGSFEAYWVSFYAFIAEQLPVEKDNLVDIAKDIVINCGAYWTFEDVVVMTEKPIAIHMKDNELHNENGLAVEYQDGTGIYAVKNVRKKSLLECVIEEEAND